MVLQLRDALQPLVDVLAQQCLRRDHCCMQLMQLHLIRLHRGELCAEVVAHIGFERAQCLLARHLLMADRLAREQQLLPRLGRALQR